MSTTLLHLTIASVAAPLFQGDVRSVTIPGADGLLTAMANHEAFVTTLRPGTIIVRLESGEEQSFPVEGGALEIASNHATVLL